MPIKRRIGKAAKLIDNLDIEELFYGPGTCLINGAGYIDGQLSRDISDEDMAAARELMRGDWQRHHQRVLSAWESRTEWDRDVARRCFGDPTEPWALTEFGNPTEKGI